MKSSKKQENRPSCAQSVAILFFCLLVESRELPAAFLINNLLEIQKATTHEDVQLPNQAMCDKHERVLEIYCNDCDVLLCSVCSIKVHRAHDCDLAADVAIADKKVIEDQLAFLRRDVSIVDSMIANVDSANDRMISGGDEIRKAITDAVEQLYRQIEEEKRELLTMVDSEYRREAAISQESSRQGYGHDNTNEKVRECCRKAYLRNSKIPLKLWQ